MTAADAGPGLASGRGLAARLGALVGRPRVAWGAWAVVVLALVVANADRHLPVGFSTGVAVQGLVIGSLTGMSSVGLIIVYRANRLINFAQTSLGLVAGVLAYHLMVVAGFPWLLAVPLSIAVAVAMAAGTEMLVVRRLSRAPRLIATVATIGITQVLAFLAITITAVFNLYHYETIEAAGQRFPTPWGSPAFVVGGVPFTYDHLLVLVLVPVVLGGLAWFFGGSIRGVAIRAAAQNGERAGLLGIRVPRLSTTAWGIAGGLSALAFILSAPVLGFYSFGSAAVAGSVGGLVRALAAAVIARLDNMPAAFAAALALGVVEQTLFFNYGQSALMELVLLLIVLSALTLQRGRISRSEWTEASTWQAIREARPIPLAVRRHPTVLGLTRALVVAGVGIPLLAPRLFDLGTVRLLSVMCIYALVGLSLVLLSGWAGQVSLGQWAFTGIGAFVTGRLASRWDVDLVVALVAAGLAGAFIALLVGLPALRIRGLFLGATTLLLATMTSGWLLTLDRVRIETRFARPTVFGVLRAESEPDWFYVVFAVLVAAVVAVAAIRRSEIGRRLIAVRDNEAAAQAYAIEPAYAKLGVFAVAGFIAAMAGTLYAYLQQTVNVTQFLPATSLFLFAMIVIGGLGSIAGAILGAVYVLGAQYFLPEAGGFLATGLGMLVLLLFLPGGLSELMYRTRDRVLLRLTGPQ